MRMRLPTTAKIERNKNAVVRLASSPLHRLGRHINETNKCNNVLLAYMRNAAKYINGPLAGTNSVMFAESSVVCHVVSSN